MCHLLADLGEARGCSTNTSVIHSLMVWENIFAAPPHPNGHKIDYVKLHYWFKSYGNFAKLVDFAY